jgi:hypothetical protein
MRRRLVLGLLLFGLIEMATGIAVAGGAVWHFDGEHQPGDIAVSVTSVAWDHDSGLGTPAEGPYLIYLVPEAGGTEASPDVPAEGMLVGIVEIVFGPYQAEDGEWYGPHHAIARFEIPTVPPGSYLISHCNDPCTNTLGDITGGWGLQVVDGSRGRSPAEIADEVMESLTTYRHPVPPPEPEQSANADLDGSEETMVTDSIDRELAPKSSPPTSLAAAGRANRADDGRWNASWSVVIAISLAIGLINLIRWQREPVRSHLVANHTDEHSSADRPGSVGGTTA